MAEQSVDPRTDERSEQLESERCAESLTDQLSLITAEQYRAGDLWALYRQDIWWTTSRGTIMPIRILEDSHRLNIARMLLRTAGKLYPAYREDLLLRYQSHELADLTTDPRDPPQHMTDQDAQDWMSSTVLYRRIVRGLPDPARPASGPAPTAETQP